MNPATEYLLRRDCIRASFRVPVSLFFQDEIQRKMVVTIKHEFPESDHYVVNQWHISECRANHVLPSISEFRILRSDVFSHQSVMLSDWRLLSYRVDSVPDEQNTYHTPMLEETYDYYYEDIFNSLLHREAKVDWLWNAFVKIYFPEIWQSMPYIGQKDSLSELAEKQRTLVMKDRPQLWSVWKKWSRYMLFPEFIPGELVFAKDRA